MASRGPEGAGELSDFEAMGLALDEARRAAEAGEVPVGAVVLGGGPAENSGPRAGWALAAGGPVLASAGNAREALGDPTAHAEVLALRRAAAKLGTWRLGGAQVFVTLEPCPMCAGALVAARVSRLVFGAADPKAGACGSLYNLCADPRLNHEVTVVGGVRSDECASLLSSWFARRR